MKPTIVDLIRHGEPQGGSRYRGHRIDDPLSEKGWQQMWQAIGTDNQWQQIVSSPMLRCCEFAKQLAGKHNTPLCIEDDFKEVGFGSWEGLSREQVKLQNLTEYNNFYTDPVNNRPSGSEDLKQFMQRVVHCYSKIVEQFQTQHILIVAHAGVIRTILAHSVQAPPAGIYNFKVNNAGIARIQINHGNEAKAQSSEVIFLNQSFANSSGFMPAASER